MLQLYASQWRWVVEEKTGFGYWTDPGGDAVGKLDIRKPSDFQVRGGTPEGIGLFGYEGKRNYKEIVADFGSDITRDLSFAEKAFFASLFNLQPSDITESSIRMIIAELMYSNGQGTTATKYDVSGTTLHRPLRGSLLNGVNLNIGGFGTIFAEPFGPQSAAWRAKLDVFQYEYRQLRPLAMDQMELNNLRRWTGRTMLEFFGRAGDDLVVGLLPAEYEKDGWLPSASIIGDTMVEDVSDTALGSHTATGPNGGFAWTEVTDSWTVREATDDLVKASSATDPGMARAEGVLDGDSHRADITVTAHGANDRNGACTRFAAAANTCVAGMHRNTGSNGFTIFKVDAGTFTAIAGPTGSPLTPTFFLRMRSQADDTHQFFADTFSPPTTQRLSVSDAHGAANVRCGVTSRETVNVLDDFEAEDLAAVLTSELMIVSQQQQIQPELRPIPAVPY